MLYLLSHIDCVVANSSVQSGPFSVFPVYTPHLPPCIDNPIIRRNQPASSPSDERLSLIPAPSTSCQRPLAARLFHHYVTCVSTLLQPVGHLTNYYNIVYTPQAMIGAGNLFGPTILEPPSSTQSIFYSLLATAAFHLRGIQAEQTLNSREMDRIGRFCRMLAYQHLRRGLESTEDLQTAMAAVLSMVTIDVMEGNLLEYWHHLKGFQQLRLLQGATTSSKSIQTYLQTIFYFQSTLSQSTDCSLPQIPWPVDTRGSLMHIQALTAIPDIDNHLLQQTYSITSTLVMFIRLITCLSQHVSYFISEQLSLPKIFCDALATLEKNLHLYDIGCEKLINMTPIQSTLFRLHLLAFQQAIHIYYLTSLVLPLETQESHGTSCIELRVQRYARQVGNYLLRIEFLKRESTTPCDGFQTAPIPWPGFIASCEADPSQRQLWTEWWTGMLGYQIGNIHVLFEIVQDVWRSRDQLQGKETDKREYGEGRLPIWKRVLSRGKKRILAL
ncbi:fungal-specific transcription factor domain-containing protein [Talaromyces proteolyticus]|uniref:Fungal-specific transcription factor domain-containing protein n=1 Tax=Talaromyces proteolyticus TaxID=1131652 RepID=A0AAD4Q4Z5_9EURO|nr:fungal-specific transcription factor domain-containing protein [Talaromyces proteolyticus]KAH8703776.1 fungal-specific transcription factor domain-containing protein [Talaromyces proteolyticus]